MPWQERWLHTHAPGGWFVPLSHPASLFAHLFALGRLITLLAYPHSWGAKAADKQNPLWSTWKCSEMETIRREGSSKLLGQHHPASLHLCFTSVSLGWTNLIMILEFAGSGLSGIITGKLRLSTTGVRRILLALSALIDAQVWWRGASPPGELIEPCCADCGIAAAARAKTPHGVSGRWYWSQTDSVIL